MPIGNGPDIEQFNRADEALVKLGDEVNTWWELLDDNYKFELLEPYYPDRLHLMGMNDAWDSLSWNDQLDIYKEANGYGEGVGV